MNLRLCNKLSQRGSRIKWFSTKYFGIWSNNCACMYVQTQTCSISLSSYPTPQGDIDNLCKKLIESRRYTILFHFLILKFSRRSNSSSFQMAFCEKSWLWLPPLPPNLPTCLQNMDRGRVKVDIKSNSGHTFSSLKIKESTIMP